MLCGERYYFAAISNTGDGRWMGWVPRLLYTLGAPRFGESGFEKTWEALDLPLKVAYVLGWRHLSFGASVAVLNGTVSGTM